MRNLGRPFLAVGMCLVALVLCSTHDEGRLQAQELTDRQILVNLYNATGGPNWTNDENWNTAADLDTWHGVSTNAQGQVRSLELPSNQLSGEIPSELGKLTGLTSLGLNNNQLSGEIPPELGDLANLTWLYLYGNQLTGEIPSELGDLTLSYLDLSNNQLSGEIPADWEILPACRIWIFTGTGSRANYQT